ncbi:MAG: hypothetical protein KatS3mg008_1877 [Acidimicrobiales bacterium]|nr:MAG: hypothetical protein KatS3mg008_1877 [Acidimicrobiales bacterium]
MKEPETERSNCPRSRRVEEAEVQFTEAPADTSPAAVWLVADSLPVGLVAGKLGGMIRYTNRTFRETFKIDPTGVSGIESIFKHVHPDDRDLVLDRLGQFVPGENASFRVRIVGDDGVARRAEVKVVTIQHPLVESDYVAILSDVTAEEELESYLEEVGKLAAIGRFAGTLAHDLKNAIVSARMGLAVTTRELSGDTRFRDDAEVVARLEKADAVLACAEEMITNVFRIAQDQPLRPGESDLPATVRDIVDSPDWLGTCAVRLEVGDSAARVRVPLAEHDLKSLFCNLLTNSLEAGAENIVIRVAVSKPTEVTCEIVDDGCGMPESVLSKAFEPLFTTKGDRDGRGFGLTSVLDTVRRAGGRVRIDSAPGEGTSVVLTLPIVESSSE